MPSDIMEKGNSTLAKEEEILKSQFNRSAADEKKLLDIKKANQIELEQEKLRHDKEIEDALHQGRLRNLAEEGKNLEAIGEEFNTKIKGAWEGIKTSFTSGEFTKGLTEQVDSIIDNYIDAQEKLSAHLVGANSDLNSIISNLNSSLASNSLVRQEAVYNNLSKLVNSGITYNVEQRAFLQTLSDDLGMVFNAENGTLTRLIRLYGDDISANRLSLEYSLQEFLNQNYDTSEYIKDAFTDVSNSLVEMQSLVSSSQAVALETDIQTWLGSYYSAGMNTSTVNNLAKALNELGSGDISNLGNGISNLILMGAARAGLDYGSLLTNGMSTTEVSRLMSGVTGYLQEMGDYGNNVVKSQLASLFGVSVSDLMASKNLGGEEGTVSSDIYSTLFSDLTGLVPWQKQLGNVLDNAMFTWGTSVAGSTGNYLTYQLEKLLANSGIGQTISNIGSSIGGLAGLPLTLAGIGISNAPLLSLVTSGAFTDILGSLGKSIFGGGVSNIFNSLGSVNSLGTDVKVSGAGLSGTMYISTGSDDILGGANSSISDFTDTLNIENEETEEPIDLIQSDVADILSVLNLYMEGISDNISSISESLSRSDFGQLGG